MPWGGTPPSRRHPGLGSAPASSTGGVTGHPPRTPKAPAWVQHPGRLRDEAAEGTVGHGDVITRRFVLAEPRQLHPTAVLEFRGPRSPQLAGAQLAGGGGGGTAGWRWRGGREAEGRGTCRSGAGVTPGCGGQGQGVREQDLCQPLSPRDPGTLGCRGDSAQGEAAHGDTLPPGIKGPCLQAG